MLCFGVNAFTTLEKWLTDCQYDSCIGCGINFVFDDATNCRSSHGTIDLIVKMYGVSELESVYLQVIVVIAFLTFVVYR